MADSQGGSPGELKFVESDLKVPEGFDPGTFDPEAKVLEEDFASQLDKMAKEAQARQQVRQVDLKLADFDLDTGLASTEVVESPVEQWLREAKRLISEEQYLEALPLLHQVLAEVPGHHEATYLLAFCQVRQGDDREAIKTLFPLRQVRLERHLDVRVADLRDEIRHRLFLLLILETLLYLSQKKPLEAARQVQEVLELDPEWESCHFLVSGLLMQAERFHEALAAVDRGLAICPQESGFLHNLRRQILRRLCAKEMAPARALFKKQLYREARAKLKSLDRLYRQVPVYTAFDGYLARLGGGFWGFMRRKTAGQVTSPGSGEGMEDLYFFLVEEELREAKELLQESQSAKAEPILRRALDCCPGFPYANYLYAGCLFQYTAEMLNRKPPPGIDEVVGNLRCALASSQVGATDPEIREPCLSLGKEIKNALDLMETARQEIKRQEEEAGLINKALEEFNRIIESVKGGITSSQQYYRVREQMKGLHGRVQGLKRQVTSPGGKKVLADLTNAVENHLTQLNRLEAEVQEGQTVERHFQAFQALTNSLERGAVRSPSDLRRVVDTLTEMRTTLTQEIRQSRSAEARQALELLLSRVDDALSQLEQVRHLLR
jgi:tetratricopeptide (TPR) repeat protein